MATNSEAKIKFKADTSEFNAQIKQANSTMSELRSELKLNAEQMKTSGSSAELLGNRNKILSQQMEAAKAKTQALQSKLDAAKKSFGEDSTEAGKLRTQLNYAKIAEERIAQQIKTTDKALETQGTVMTETGSKAGKFSAEFSEAIIGLLPASLQPVASELTTTIGAAGGAAGAAAGAGVAAEATAALSKFVAPAAVVAATAAVGKGLFDVGESFDEMYDTIAVGTGATGDALADLDDVAREVMSDTSGSADLVGSKLADLNTRTGATGETLEGLTEQFVELDEVGQSLDVNTATGAMNAWKIGADDMGDALDDVFLVSQSTGASMDTLMSTLSTNATSMQSLGFSFQQSAVMAGLFDKAGLNASSMMSKLSKAATNFAKDGEDPAEALQKNIDKMQAYIDKGDEAGAIDIASELFGTKGATQFVQALETGTMNIDELTEAVTNSSGDIERNAESTKSWDENMERLKNNANLLLEPLGSAVFSGASAALGALADGAGAAYRAINQIRDAAMANEDVKSILSSIGSVMQSVGSIGKSAFGALKPVITALSPAVSQLGKFFSGVFANGLRLASGVIKTAAGALNTLAKAFKGDFKLPAIKLPHFKVYGGELPWGIGGQGKAPSISVNWYAGGGKFTGPSVIGVGEAGTEYALRPNHLLEIADILASKLGFGGGGISVTVNATTNASADEIAATVVTAMTNGIRRLDMIGA